MAGITRCKVLFLIKVHRVTQTLSSCKKYRIDLRKTVKVSGTRCYVERPFIHIEAGMPPSANVRGDRRFDLALG